MVTTRVALSASRREPKITTWKTFETHTAALGIFAIIYLLLLFRNGENIFHITENTTQSQGLFKVWKEDCSLFVFLPIRLSKDTGKCSQLTNVSNAPKQLNMCRSACTSFLKTHRRQCYILYIFYVCANLFIMSITKVSNLFTILFLEDYLFFLWDTAIASLYNSIIWI